MIYLLCRLLGHGPQLERIKNNPARSEKTVERFCSSCKRVLLREVYVKVQWGYERVKEEYFK